MDETPNVARPLSGLRVVEIANFMSGPMIGVMLADFGADVTKIEKTDGGDDARLLPPRLGGEGHFFVQLDRNKRSVSIDLKDRLGVDLIARLIGQADVVIDNFRPGTLRRAGLDYDAIRSSNPGLISCSVTGFGEGNGYAGRASYDPILQGVSGLMMATGFDGDPPIRAGAPVMDLVAALLGTTGILAALQEREKSGLGQHVDVSLLGAATTLMRSQIFSYWAKGAIESRGPRSGIARSLIPVVETSDRRKIQVALGNHQIFQRLCAACDCPELVEDPRFSSMGALSQHVDELGPILEHVFSKHDFSYWDEALSKYGVPWGPINDVVQFFDDPVVQEGFVSSVLRSDGERLPAMRTAVGFSRSPVSPLTPPPALGEHTEAILRERLGLLAEEIQTLRDRGVIRCSTTADEP